MSRPENDYYQVLGVPTSATPEQIKKRYRELARQFHPDVNPSADAAQKIKVINEAYHVLGDAERKATYDAERLLRSLSRQEPETRKSDSVPRTTARPAPPRPAPSSGREEYNGFGRATPDGQPRTASPGGYRPPTPPAAASTTHRPQPAASKPPRDRAAEMAAAEKLVNDAKLAFINRNYRAAEELCQQALQRDSRNAIAHEILGDVYAKKGLAEKANAAYSYAVQSNPRNVSAMAKMERLAGRERSGPRPTMTHPMPQTDWRAAAPTPQRDVTIVFSSVLILLLLGFGLWMFRLFPGQPMFGDLSPNLLVAAMLSGVGGGILLAFFGSMKPLSQALTYNNGNASHRPVSLAGMLGICALVWLYISLLLYAFVALRQRKASFSVLRAYGVTILTTLLLTLLYAPERAPGAHWQTLAFAGNLTFPALLCGWAIGDAVRLSR